MRLALILNPVATSVTERLVRAVEDLLRRDHDVRTYPTTGRGDAIELAARAAATGADVVIALGGDGTVNEVANGVLGTGCPIAPLPGGSTSVMARSLGYPNDLVAATHRLLEALDRNAPVSASVGVAGGRAFLFNIGAGFDAAVVARVERRGPLKRYIGQPLFVTATVATWLFDVERRRPWFTVEIDNGGDLPVAAPASALVALNTGPYSYLGPRALDLAPEAALDRPLSVLTLANLSPALLPRLVRAAFGDEGLPDRADSHHWHNVNRVAIRGHRPFPYQLDGELLGPVDHLTVAHRPDAVTIMAPPSIDDPTPRLGSAPPHH
ncbi:MAG: diacylglycerol/lipid kinase family protein [Acidimicrobiales bacterium]